MARAKLSVKLCHLIFFQVTVINACAPGGIGSGPLVANPSFEFSVSPPVGWTYCYSPVAGTGNPCTETTHDSTQSNTSPAEARREMEDNINKAVENTFQEWQIITPYSLTVTLEGDNNIAAFSVGDFPGSETTPPAGLNTGGAVTVTGIKTALTTYQIKVIVKVRTNMVLPSTQWEIIGNNILTILAANNYAVPRSKVTITNASQ